MIPKHSLDNSNRLVIGNGNGVIDNGNRVIDNGNGNRIVGYVRVSTLFQNSLSQQTKITDYCKKKNLDTSKLEFFEEIISTRKSERKIYELIKSLKAGDKLVVTEISRIARSFRETKQILSLLESNGIEFHIISPEILMTHYNTEVEKTASLQDRLQSHQNYLYFVLLGISAELEREFLRERTLAGLETARQKNKILGRKEGSLKLVERHDEFLKYYKKKLSKTAIGKLLDVSRSTVKNYINHLKKKNLLDEK